MPVSVAASPARLSRRLEHLEAMLPRQSQDDRGGEFRTAGYLAMLAGWSDEALEFMVREACRRFRWFPVVHDLLDILAEYRPPVPEQKTALIACQRFAHDAFERWLENVRQGQPIGDVPEQWLRIAETQGVLRRLDDGSFVPRAAYHSTSWRAPVGRDMEAA